MFGMVMEQGVTKFCVDGGSIDCSSDEGGTSDDSSGTGAEVMMTGCVTLRRG